MRARYLALHDLAFLDTGVNPLFIGVPGTGKTFLARAVAYKACIRPHGASSSSPPQRMLSELHGAELHGDHRPRPAALSSALNLLVIDDFAVLAMDTAQAKLAFQVVSERYDYPPSDLHHHQSTLQGLAEGSSPTHSTLKVIAERLTERSEHFVLEEGFRIARP